MVGRLDDVIGFEEKINNKAERLFKLLKLIKYTAETYGTVTHENVRNDWIERTREAAYGDFGLTYQNNEHYIYGEDYYITYKGAQVFHLRSTLPVSKISDLIETGTSVKIEIDTYKSGEWEERLVSLSRKDYDRILGTYYKKIKDRYARQEALEEKQRKQSRELAAREEAAKEKARSLGPYI